MHILNGVVSKVRISVELSGGGQNSSVTTTHVSIFHLDGKPIKMKSTEIVLIDDDDHVSVAGESRNGVFNAYAYRNDTTGAIGNSGATAALIIGFIFPISGIFFINQFSNPFFGVWPKLFGLFFVFSGVYAMYKAIQILNASKLLK